jgi:hypothetical protein
MWTLDEIMEKIANRWDPDYVVEYFDITTEELLDMFTSKVAERYDELNEEFTDEH